MLGLLKQFILSKAMPLPVFSEEDYREAEREVNARADKHVKVQKSGRVVRSLHHIDDEDFEDTAEAARRRREALEAQEKADNEAKLAASGKKKGLIESAPIKEDDKADEKKDAEVETTEDNKE